MFTWDTPLRYCLNFGLPQCAVDLSEQKFTVSAQYEDTKYYWETNGKASGVTSLDGIDSGLLQKLPTNYKFPDSNTDMFYSDGYDPRLSSKTLNNEDSILIKSMCTCVENVKRGFLVQKFGNIRIDPSELTNLLIVYHIDKWPESFIGRNINKQKKLDTDDIPWTSGITPICCVSADTNSRVRELVNSNLFQINNGRTNFKYLG
jgi:hypothetical protein